jgi:hypothetical protein
MIEFFFVICMIDAPTKCEEHSWRNYDQAQIIETFDKNEWKLVRWGNRRVKDD